MKSPYSRVLSVAFALSTFACGSESAVVGGRCRDGMELRGSTCVAPAPDVTRVTPRDPAATSRGTEGPASPVERVLGQQNALNTIPVDETARAQIDPAHVDPPLPPPALVCEMPLVACHDACINVANDADNCGACGKICPSNICIAGACQGATPGDIVLIGHDYTNAWSGSAQAKVLINALTIPTTDPIRVLSYEEGGSPNAVESAKSLARAGIHGRSVKFTIAPSAEALTSSTLASGYDIVLIHDAGGGDAVARGRSWSSSLGTFAMKGGVVIALDRGTSPMPQLMSSSGLLAVGSHTTLAEGTHLAVAGAGDVIGAQVLNPYAAFGAPISFQGLEALSADLDWVVRVKGPSDTLGDAVVVHRVVR